MQIVSFTIGAALLLLGTLEIRAAASYATIRGSVSPVGPLLLIAGFTLVRVGFLA